MGSIASVRGRLLFFIAGVLIALVPVAAAVTASDDPRVLADCNDIVDTTDSFSMNCVPTVIPDTSDQLTEAEVAAPGFNAVPGGAGHEGGGGGHH